MDRIGAELSGGITATPVVVPGTPEECLIDHALTHRADLIVTGVRRRTRLSKLLIGSATETVLRRSPCPVLVVPADRENANE